MGFPTLRYTSHKSLNGLHTIKFNREGRSDHWPVYNSGAKVDENVRMIVRAPVQMKSDMRMGVMSSASVIDGKVKNDLK